MGNAAYKSASDMVHMLYNTALIRAGFILDKPKEYKNILYKLARGFVRVAMDDAGNAKGISTGDIGMDVSKPAGDKVAAMGEAE